MFVSRVSVFQILKLASILVFIAGTGIFFVRAGLMKSSTNNPPTAVADSFSGSTPPNSARQQNGRLGNPPGGLLLNDSDPDCNPGNSCISAVLQTGTANGQLNMQYGDGSFSYAPNPGYTGTDSFTYKVCDNESPSLCSAAVTVTLNDANTAPTASGKTYAGRAARSQNGKNHPTAPGGLLLGETDPDNDSVHLGYFHTNQSYLKPMVVTAPSNGTVYMPYFPGDGSFAYTPQLGFIGTDTFTYNVCDTLGACSVGIATLQANTAPLGIPDSFIAFQGETLNVNSERNILLNDHDPENDNLQVGYEDVSQNYIKYKVIEGPFHAQGFSMLYRDGTFGYTPQNNYTGYDYFVYNLCDSLGACVPTRVDLYVFPGKSTEDVGPKDCSGNATESPKPPTAFGRPVNVTNGNMYLRQTDYNLPSVGEAVKVTRTYNSQNQSSGLFGLGWSTAYDEYIDFSFGNNNMLRLQMSDGKSVYFGRNTTGIPYTSLTTDFHGTITKSQIGIYTLTFKDGRTHQFNSLGKLTAMSDRNGNQTTLNYNGSSQLISIVNPFNRTLTVTPDPLTGRVTQLSDSIGTVATYVYDIHGRLESVTYPDGSKYTFTYEIKVISSVNVHLLTEVKDALNKIIEKHEYYSDGRAKTSEVDGAKEKYTAVYNGLLTTVTDGLGRETKYHYKQIGSRKVVTKTEGACGCGNSSGDQVMTYEYDGNLNVVKKINGNTHETTYTYDADGNMLKETNSAGSKTYTYNSNGQALTVKDQVGGMTTFTYNAQGRPTQIKDALDKITTLDYYPTGELKSVTDARNKTTNYLWLNGNLQRITDANGKETNFVYDARGRLETITNALTFVTTYNYDLKNRIKKVIYPDTKFIEYKYDLAGRREWIQDTRGYKTNYGYDPVSAYRLKTVTDALNHTTTYIYDDMSNLTKITDAEGKETDYLIDAFNRVKKITYPPATTGGGRLYEEFTFDGTGQVKTHIDTALRTTTYFYDNAERLWKVTDTDSKNTEFEYDPRSLITKIKDAGTQSAATQEYGFTYDALGRQLTQTRAGTTMTYEYDAVGNRIKRVDYTGRETSYEYDNLNRLKKINYLQSLNGVAPATAIQITEYSYDDLSRLSAATNEAGTVSFTYDSRNRIKTSTDVFGHVVGYDYFEAFGTDNTKKVVKLDGSVHSTYYFDDANRMNKMTDEIGAIYNFGYTDTNLLQTKTLPNNVVTTYNYDGMSRLKQLKQESATAILVNDNYGYNSAQQINQIAGLTQTRNFTYDNVDRLAGMTSPTLPTESYNYDNVGNRNSSHRSASYAYQPFNKLTSTASATYSYDANGNMLSKSDPTGFWRYVWDSENHLVAVYKNNKSVRYQYDALGRRVSRRGKGVGVTAKYTYDGQDVILDESSEGTVKYQNGLGIDNKLKITSNGISRYFLQDHLGSTVGLTDSSGNLTSSASYDSFGNSTNNLTTRYQYTGREYDEFTGLYYYRARWYDANLGRFISEDPVGFAGGINWFSYVKNNPLNLNDPFGLQSNPFYAGCVAGYTTLGAVVGFYGGGGLGLLTGPGAVVASPVGVAVGTAAGGAIGAGVGTLVCDTSTTFPNQSDSLPNTQTQPYPNSQDKTTCDVKPRPIPRATPTPNTPPEGDGGCSGALFRCLNWAGEDVSKVLNCNRAYISCRKSRPAYFPHGEWVF